MAYMWISNYFFSEHIKGTTYIAYTTGEVYFVVLFSVAFVLFIDGIVIHIDFVRGGYISKMRDVVASEKEEIRTYYDDISLKVSEGFTINR